MLCSKERKRGMLLNRHRKSRLPGSNYLFLFFSERKEGNERMEIKAFWEATQGEMESLPPLPSSSSPFWKRCTSGKKDINIFKKKRGYCEPARPVAPPSDAIWTIEKESSTIQQKSAGNGDLPSRRKAITIVWQLAADLEEWDRSWPRRK